MEKMVVPVLIEAVETKLANHLLPIDQLSSAQNVKNNKVDRFNLPIYTILKICQIQNQPLDV